MMIGESPKAEETDQSWTFPYRVRAATQNEACGEMLFCFGRVDSTDSFDSWALQLEHSGMTSY